MGKNKTIKVTLMVFAASLIGALILLSYLYFNTSMYEKQNLISNMQKYAEEKYNSSFEVVDFIAGKRQLYYDAGFHDLLILKDKDGTKFTVYSSTAENDMFDDYGISCADKKLTDYLRSNSDLDFCSMVQLSSLSSLNSGQIMPDDVKKLSVLEFSNTYKVSKITVVVKVNETEFKEKLNEIYNLYKCVSDLNSNNIEFVILSVQGEDENLSELFDNIRLDYENDWSLYSSVKKWNTITQNNVTKEEFAELAKK